MLINQSAWNPRDLLFTTDSSENGITTSNGLAFLLCTRKEMASCCFSYDDWVKVSIQKENLRTLNTSDMAADMRIKDNAIFGHLKNACTAMGIIL